MRWHLIGIVVALIIAAVGLGFIVTGTTPDTASVTVQILFFLALFIFLWTLGILVSYAFTRNQERAFLYGLGGAIILVGGLLLNKFILS